MVPDCVLRYISSKKRARDSGIARLQVFDIRLSTAPEFFGAVVDVPDEPEDVEV